MMKSISRAPYPLSAIRTLALHAQGLAVPPQTLPTLDTLCRTVEQIGCVQIDTLHMVRRSQYVVLWSRLGCYHPADLDRLVYDPAHRRLFEYWLHAASIVPLVDYSYRLPYMRRFADGDGWWPDWAKQPENSALVQAVLERIRGEGALRNADFEHEAGARSGWWDWKPAKHALEHLYNLGELMITNRVNFQRVYDLRERVLPDWVDRTEPTPEETRRHLIERSARALGTGEPGHAADYAYEVRRPAARETINHLLADGHLIEIQGILADGQSHPLIVHRDHLPLLAQAADGTLQAHHTTFLSPFDSLFWARGRDQAFWNFRQVLEAYKREPDRIWGYFCLPILHRDRLVGRFDPKLERKTGTLRLKALYLEPGIEPADDRIADIAGAMRDFLAFHNARNLVIERSDPPEFGQKLSAAL
jgi:uncharacterized protein YcaQ